MYRGQHVYIHLAYQCTNTNLHVLTSPIISYMVLIYLTDKHHYSLWGSIFLQGCECTAQLCESVKTRLLQSCCKVVDSILPCYKVVIDRAGANGLAGQVLA